VSSDAHNFNVTIKCTKSIDLVSGAISSFTYQIVLASPSSMIKSLPVFAVSPSLCSSGSFSYQLVYLDGPDFPPFITQFPASSISVMTQNTTLVGNYNFKLQATEPVSGLINQADNFTVTITPPNYATNLVWVNSTLLANITYLVGSPQVLTISPSFTTSPSNADVQF
jgi:hypothetical protein